MSVYTKKGDRGKTSFVAKGDQVFKDNIKVEALGALDELNSWLGICREGSLDKLLKNIQKKLFIICAILAGAKRRFYKISTEKLEREIDEMIKELPKLSSFVFSGGNDLSAKLMYARALARRAERRVVGLSKEENVNSEILRYLNRLSDYLFMMSRRVKRGLGEEEELWRG